MPADIPAEVILRLTHWPDGDWRSKLSLIEHGAVAYLPLLRSGSLETGQPNAWWNTTLALALDSLDLQNPRQTASIGLIRRNGGGVEELSQFVLLSLDRLRGCLAKSGSFDKSDAGALLAQTVGCIPVNEDQRRARSEIGLYLHVPHGFSDPLPELSGVFRHYDPRHAVYAVKLPLLICPEKQKRQVGASRRSILSFLEWVRAKNLPLAIGTTGIRWTGPTDAEKTERYGDLTILPAHSVTRLLESEGACFETFHEALIVASMKANAS